MKEKRFDVKPIKIEAVCDCGGVYEMNSNLVLNTYPPQYQYKCNKCGKTTTSTEIYPKILHEEIQNEIEINKNDNKYYISDNMDFSHYFNRIYTMKNKTPEPVETLRAFCLLYGHENSDSERGILISAITDFFQQYQNILEENIQLQNKYDDLLKGYTQQKK